MNNIKKYKIAVIDDEDSIRELLVEIIKSEFDADFYLYQDAEYIVEEIEKTKFDLILTDYKMPLLDGNAFIKRLRLTKNLNSNTPVIFITGEQPEIIADDKVAKDIFFIQKPFEFLRIIYYVKLSLMKA